MARGSLRSGWTAMGTLTTTLLVAGSADARTLRGTAELQYQNTEAANLSRPVESWTKLVRVDHDRRLPASLEFSSHFVFSEWTLARLPDRTRNFAGTLQLAHPYFGLLTSYRPAEVRDAHGFTTRQQELSLSGNVQKSGLPQLSGTWVRRHHTPDAGSPGFTSVARSLSAAYTRANTSLRAGYGDRYQAIQDAPNRRREDHFGLGSSTQLRIRRADVSLNYDFGQSRTSPGSSRSQVSRTHTAGVSSGLQISERTSSSLSYSFRHTKTVARSASRSDEHVGAFSLAHRPSPGIEVSGGGGVRNAMINGLIETERYVTAGATAEGEARPGWRLGAGAGHSVNWLPGQPGRPMDSFRSDTRMRLAPGLEANGNLLISTSRSLAGAPGRTGPGREFSLQTGAGINAHPLRTLSMDGTVSRYGAGPSLVRVGSSSTTHAGNLRLRPSSKLQLNGGWGRTSSQGSTGTSRQGSIQWSPNRSIQISGNYSRGRQESRGTAARATSGQESWSGSVVMALTRDLTGTFRYTESNPGQVSHVRQVNATLVQRFGR